MRILGLAVLLGGLALAGGGVWAFAQSGEGRQAALAVPALAPQTVVPHSVEETKLSFSPVVRRTAPAVVNITTKTYIEQRLHPFANDPFFAELFQRRFGRSPINRGEETSLGSGVIVEASGIVLTNAHVVGAADEITVALSDRREFPARILLADELSDLAVLQIEGAQALPFLEFGDSDALEPGDLVLAIGNPFGVGQTVTSGIVSAVMRARDDGQVFIQTDAAINPGNSGGALVDMQGRLVGVNTAILSKSGGFQGVGFAIPSNLARRAVDSAATGSGTLEQPWSGAEVSPLTTEAAAKLGMAAPSGVALERLHPQSPLAKAGLKPGDVILSADGLDVYDAPSFRYRLHARPIGTKADIVYIRDGRRQTAQVERIAAPSGGDDAPAEIGGRTPLSGMLVVELTPALAASAGFSEADWGIVVQDEGYGSGARLGLRAGDLLVEVNGVEIRSMKDLGEALDEAPGLWRVVARRGERLLNFQARVR